MDAKDFDDLNDLTIMVKNKKILWLIHDTLQRFLNELHPLVEECVSREEYSNSSDEVKACSYDLLLMASIHRLGTVAKGLSLNNTAPKGMN